MENRLSAIGVVDSTAGFEACLDRRGISAVPFGFRHAAGHEKRPSPHTKLHEKYDTDCWQTS